MIILLISVDNGLILDIFPYRQLRQKAFPEASSKPTLISLLPQTANYQWTLYSTSANIYLNSVPLNRGSIYASSTSQVYSFYAGKRFRVIKANDGTHLMPNRKADWLE
ncbi:hypothetical protein AVEN_136168-1 [Araneus ventricosus]|uniref:Uncharacterized protein n=1 Tax=Araneus ventricosus TaxID=182803 RepID=A0A4Y2IIV4_ARAVE|nr:hypothetical protein AVEN_136168-1 [Araneus ventricosus]